MMQKTKQNKKLGTSNNDTRESLFIEDELLEQISLGRRQNSK